jgi:hypothetical protein
MAGKGRPNGSSNKPKFRNVPLGELTSRLKDTVLIPVKKEWVDIILVDTVEDEEDIIEDEEDDTPTIAFTKHVVTPSNETSLEADASIEQ